MSTNAPRLAIPTPAGFSVPGSRGDAAPDSVLAQLRADVAHRREERPVVLEWKLGESSLRATYGTLAVDEVERYMTSAQIDTSRPLTGNLEVLARACRSIEVLDGERWVVLEDAAGPVTFDDRLARLLDWERPDPEFRYAVGDVYEGMFDGDGFAVMSHQAKALQGLGLVEEVGPDLATGGSPTRSATPPRSG